MDLIAEMRKCPERLQPNVFVTKLNAPIEIVRETMLLSKKAGTPPSELHGVVRFVWIPHGAIEFEGTYEGEYPEIVSKEYTLRIPKTSEETPVIITSFAQADSGWTVHGIMNSCAVRTTGMKAERLVFHLVNFPDYIGLPIRAEAGHKIKTFSGRITIESEQWIGVIDSIPEARHLCEEQKQNGGFYISHVGEIRPKNERHFDTPQLDSIYSNLRYLLGFCRGAWTGPVFPRGIKESEIVWEPLAAWRIGSSRKVLSWFPTRNPIGEFPLFSGFMDKIHDPVWKSPLSNAISWYVEANKPEIANEGRIVLVHVALEMLSWAFFVDFNHHCTAEEFRRIPAHKKIRKLLSEFGIPTVIPSHLNELQMISREAFGDKDAPYVLATIRNALVHSTEENRRIVNQLNGTHLYDMAQMGIGYVELVILALCGYEGSYARRGWRGWKGTDEIPVPWKKGQFS